MIVFKGYTHISVSLALFLILRRLIEFDSPVVLLGIINVVGSLLPDIDCQYSVIGKHFRLINKFIPHRNGITHSLVGSFLWCGLAIGFGKEYFSIMWIGFISHLVLDSFTPMGIKWLYPIKKDKYGLNVGNKDFVEGIVCLVGLMVVYYEWMR